MRSGHDTKLVYQTPSADQSEKKNRKRKIIWYNPPYSINVKTNVGGQFLRLVRTHFHKDHAYHKIFNKNTVKISYSCTRNVDSMLRSHNKSLLEKKANTEKKCNCNRNNICPLNGECISENVVYKAIVIENPAAQHEKHYIGLATKFKDRFAVHKQGFNHRQYANRCELSKHIWKLKDDGKTYSLKWEILRKVKGKLIAGTCKLCTTEKMYIIEYPDRRKLLNSNWINKCPHGKKNLLSEKINAIDTMD